MASTAIATLKTYFETGDSPTQSQFTELIDSVYPREKLHITDTALAPAAAGAPTVAELQAYIDGLNATPLTVVDALAYYTGDDLPASDPTYTYWVDAAGSVTQLGSASESDTTVSPDTNTSVVATDTGIDFTVNWIAVGSVTESSGTPKWTLNGILDPAVYFGSPQTVAERDALVAASPATKVGYLVNVVDTGISEYQRWNGSAWKSIASPISGDIIYRGALAGNSNLNGDATGNAYLDGSTEVAQGDMFKVSSDGLLTTVDGANIAVKAGDNVYFNAASADAAIADAIIDIIDNTEAVMSGATVSAAGAEGNVPAPLTGDDIKLLSGAGTYVLPAVVKVLDSVDFVTAEPM